MTSFMNGPIVQNSIQDLAEEDAVYYGRSTKFYFSEIVASAIVIKNACLGVRNTNKVIYYTPFYIR